MKIDWLWVAVNAVWVVGLAISLAIFSLKRYQREGRLADWTQGWWVFLAGQFMTVMGLLLTQALWNWTLISVLWLGWTFLDRFVFIHNPARKE